MIDYVKTIEAAKMLGVSDMIMRRWRVSGKGPKFLSTVGYMRTEIEAFKRGMKAARSIDNGEDRDMQRIRLPENCPSISSVNMVAGRLYTTLEYRDIYVKTLNGRNVLRFCRQGIVSMAVASYKYVHFLECPETVVMSVGYDEIWTRVLDE